MNFKPKAAQLSFILIVIFFLSCANYFTIIKQQPKNPLLIKYRNLYIGWLDLGVNNWKNFGYISPNQWKTAIHEMNILGLHKYLVEFLPEKNISGSTTPIDNFQATTGLYIKFSYAAIAHQGEHLALVIKCIDIEEHNLVYTAQVIIENKRSGFQYPFSGLNDMSFEGRLDNLVYNLAWFLSIKINEYPQ